MLSHWERESHLHIKDDLLLVSHVVAILVLSACAQPTLFT